jgi:hypothetical protein
MPPAIIWGSGWASGLAREINQMLTFAKVFWLVCQDRPNIINNLRIFHVNWVRTLAKVSKWIMFVSGSIAAWALPIESY